MSSNRSLPFIRFYIFFLQDPCFANSVNASYGSLVKSHRIKHVHFLNEAGYNVHEMNNEQKSDLVTLQILETIENHSDLTQRRLASQLGVALGLANSYLKRCVRKGLIKIQQVPANRYLYYLTPQGFAEKSRLTADYLIVSFEFYRRASRAYTDLMQRCESEGKETIILCGISELTEIASLRALDNGINVIGIFDPDANENRFMNFPVWEEKSDLPEADCMVLTALYNTISVYQKIKESDNNVSLMVPEILDYVCRGPGDIDG